MDWSHASHDIPYDWHAHVHATTGRTLYLQKIAGIDFLTRGRGFAEI